MPSPWLFSSPEGSRLVLGGVQVSLDRARGEWVVQADDEPPVVSADAEEWNEALKSLFDAHFHAHENDPMPTNVRVEKRDHGQYMERYPDVLDGDKKSVREQKRRGRRNREGYKKETMRQWDELDHVANIVKSRLLHFRNLDSRPLSSRKKRKVETLYVALAVTRKRRTNGADAHAGCLTESDLPAA